jgi:UDP-N-acetylglucosamine--N-acetylmuramyl-(pentapeptide) pyrophosphoryl-undecaprenol N-acetylglucosamine transferase
MSQKVALIMAGGTGGHIFPGLAVAEALLDKGWRVHWLGAPDSMESRLVPQRGIPLELVEFGGVRGKGLLTLAVLPFKLLRAFWQSLKVVRRVKPDVMVGLGGYITFPGGMMGVLCGKPLVLHEQNSVAGLANKVLAGVADRVFSAFPGVLPKAQWVGNPLRSTFLRQPDPEVRFAGRSGPLKLLVVGGSLGARALNTVVPRALALLPESQRPVVMHQAGEKQMEELLANYAAAAIPVEIVGESDLESRRNEDVGAARAAVSVTPFISDTAQAFADADLVICRAGASTVTEISAVGAAAAFVPFPSAVDDHQTRNARFLVDQGGGWLLPQTGLTPRRLADMLLKTDRSALLQRALGAKKMQKLHATEAVVAACEELAT